MNGIVPLLIGALASTACATSRPPQELIDARSAYTVTATTRADDPALLGATRDALARAERSFAHHGDIEQTRDLAYVAERTAEVAQSAARVATAQRALRRAEEERANVQRLGEGSRVPRDTIEALIYTTGALARERLATQEAARKAVEPIDDLHRLIPMLQRSLSGGWSVTLTAPNVFDAGAIVIGRPSPQLDAIAHTIVATNPDAIVTVESHADSHIGEVHDVFVARMRANAVAAYLSTHGVPHDHLRSVGLGPRHILPGSASYDMRGLDRRIKITVE